jgi:hypothetical protein
MHLCIIFFDPLRRAERDSSPEFGGGWVEVIG